MKHLKIYGSRVFVRLPEEKRKNKWADKAVVGVLVGYARYGYRVLVKGRVFVARHVEVIENATQLICLEKRDNEMIEIDDEDNVIELNSNNEIENVRDENDCENSPNNNENENVICEQNIVSQENDIGCGNRRSNRTRNPVQRYGDPVTYFIYVNFVNANVPSNFNQAINSYDAREWKNAMEKEINCLNKNNTWQIVERPKDKKIIDVKWVYNLKKNNTYKARLVVLGYQQTENLENVYSPVGKMQTLKVLLSYCCTNSFYIEQMDVETAFLNGKIKSEVYIYEPQGYETGKNKVCKLNKALYGLSESPRVWYETLDEYVGKLNFIKSKNDNCLYYKRTGNEKIYLLVFVDDLLICAKSKKEIKEVKIQLMKNFVMKDLGDVESYIGIDIDYNVESNKMKLSQEKYIVSLAEKYNLTESKSYETPMEKNLKLEQAECTDERIKYRNLIGELLYISSGTRPDIAFSVNFLSRYQNCFNQNHYKYAMRVLRYLIGTKHLSLIYEKIENCEKLDCMVDSDYAGDSIDRRSTSGYVLRMCGNLIYWKCKKQNSVTKNSTFAEYVAMSEAVTEVLFIKNLLNEAFEMNINKPIKIYEDNSGAIAIAKFGNLTKNSKHIEVQYHYINENCQSKNIEIIKIKSEENLADILTKSLEKEKFVFFRKELKLL